MAEKPLSLDSLQKQAEEVLRFAKEANARELEVGTLGVLVQIHQARDLHNIDRHLSELRRNGLKTVPPADLGF